MNLTHDSVLEMHELAQRQENEEEILIGRTDISNFIVLPVIGVDIIELLDSGKTIGEVAKIMEERVGEPVDVLDFAKDLVTEYHFVYKVDGTIVNDKVKQRGHFSWISPRLSQLLSNRYTMSVALLLFLLGWVLIISEPDLLPVPDDFFISSSSLTLSLLIAFLLSWTQLFFHELSHLIAARSYDVSSRIGLSHRLVFVVAETNMSNIVLLPREKRYKPLLAGMAFDCVVFGTSVLLLWMNSVGYLDLAPLMVSILAYLKLNCVFVLAFQFMFFMETDIYYVFTTAFQCNNLLHNTRLQVMKFLRLAKPWHLEELEQVDPREKAIMRWYVWFYVIGALLAISLFVIFILPVTLTFIVGAVKNLFEQELFSLAFFDGLLIFFIGSLPTGILIWSWIRSFRNWRAAQAARASEEG